MKNKLRCVIIDDEEMATKVIESHLSHVEEMEVVGVFHSGVEAFLALDRLDVDLMFLDIQMPKMTGLAMLKKLKNPPLTVLTTAHRDYALEGFDLDVVDYLLKPIGIDRFLQTVHKIRRFQQTEKEKSAEASSAQDHLFIKANRNYVKLYFQDIQYIEALKNHVKIVTPEATHLSLIPLSEFFLQLPPPHFLRVHRSYVINVQHIDTFNSHHLHIQGRAIPIGRSYREATKLSLEKRIQSS